MWWKVLFSSSLYEGLFRELKKNMCFHFFFIFIGECALDWVRIKGVRPFYHYTDRKPVFNLIDVRQVGITRGIHIKIRRQLGNKYAFFVSMKVRKKYFRPLPYTFRLLSGGEIQHRYLSTRMQSCSFSHERGMWWWRIIIWYAMGWLSRVFKKCCDWHKKL